MHRTQLLLPPDLHRRAAQAAKARRMSLGHLVREALRGITSLAPEACSRPRKPSTQCSWPSRSTILIRTPNCH